MSHAKLKMPRALKKIEKKKSLAIPSLQTLKKKKQQHHVAKYENILIHVFFAFFVALDCKEPNKNKDWI